MGMKLRVAAVETQHWFECCMTTYVCIYVYVVYADAYIPPTNSNGI